MERQEAIQRAVNSAAINADDASDIADVVRQASAILDSAGWWDIPEAEIRDIFLSPGGTAECADGILPPDEA